MTPSAAQLLDAFGAGIYLLFGVVHLDIWWRSRERRADLWLGTAAFAALLVDVTGMILELSPGEPAAWAVLLNGVSVAGATVCLYQLVATLEGRPVGRAARALQLAVLGVSPLAGFVSSILHPATQALSLLLLIAAMARAFLAARRGDPEAGLVARGFLVLNVCLVASLLPAFGVEKLPPGLPILGFAVLFLASARSLNDRSRREHRELEALKRDLEGRVEERTSDLREANRLLAEASHTDPLTGLPNRRAFLPEADGALERSRRSGKPVSVAIGDLDRFKRINDTRGHAAGDRALVAVAAAIRAGVRNQDAVARWGGEEFVVLLPDTDLAGAAHVAEKLRAAVAALPVTFDDEPMALTVSFGVAQQVPGAPFDRTLAAADRALYRAKEEGRDRVVLEPV